MADTPKPYRIPTATPPEQVNKFHELSDVDSHDLAFHHTLGTSPGQAASGPALAALELRIAELETAPVRLDSGSIASRSTLIPNWNFGTNYVVKHGYLCHLYFNLQSVSGISATATGDIANVVPFTLTDPALIPLLRMHGASDVTGPSGTVITLGEDGTVTVSALAPNLPWSAGSTRSFSTTFITDVFGL